MRARLPNRRRATTTDLEFEGSSFSLTVGFDPAGRPAEIFLRAKRPNSAIDRLCDDASVLASVAMQMGADPAALARSIGTGSPVGAALAILKDAKP